jgi:ABC-type thiamine transport system substrate-binding protein
MMFNPIPRPAHCLLQRLPFSPLSFSGAQAADKTLTIYTYESFTSEWGPGPR